MAEQENTHTMCNTGGRPGPELETTTVTYGETFPSAVNHITECIVGSNRACFFMPLIRGINGHIVFFYHE